MTTNTSIIAGTAAGPVVATEEALSFWGGVDPSDGHIIDVFHPLHGRSIAGAVLLMPSSRGSCTGSGVLLELLLSGHGPAALVFREPEDVLTLGALVAAEMFGKVLPVIRLAHDDFAALSSRPDASITTDGISAGGLSIRLNGEPASGLELSEADRAMLAGEHGNAVRQAMRIIVAMAEQQGATQLVSVSRAHIDGCIYASPANLTFAERMRALDARVTVPTTMNAISVDHENWRRQGVDPGFGRPAQALADAYVAMGCMPTYTCAPYLLETVPGEGEAIGWSESNAVIFANSVLGARTPKHPDFLDLCIAITGRVPLAGVYLQDHRRPSMIIDFDLPDAPGDSFWPLVGYLAGRASPDKIPLLRGLSAAGPNQDDLKALCAAFGTTSAAPMLHIEGITPEQNLAPRSSAPFHRIGLNELKSAWLQLNAGPSSVELVAIGSPHASVSECRALAEKLGDRRVVIPVIVTAGRDVIGALSADGILQRLMAAGVQVVPDICWCSISEPVFPVATATVLTNSGKYAHYGPGLSGRSVRFGDLEHCVEAALTGRSEPGLPVWLATV